MLRKLVAKNRYPRKDLLVSLRVFKIERFNLGQGQRNLNRDITFKKQKTPGRLNSVLYTRIVP